MTRRAMLASVAGVLLEHSKRLREKREWDELFAYGQARMRARLKAEGLDLDRMSEDEVMDYVDRVIHEHRRSSGRRNERSKAD